MDSVRSLKFEIEERVFDSILESTAVKQSLGVPASARSRNAEEILPIVLGIAQGEGKNDYRLAVRLQQDLPEKNLAVEKIMDMAHDETEVRFIGRVHKRQLPWHQERQRPLLIGSSIGHHAITAGTIAGFPALRSNRRKVVLSNNHVLANEDRGHQGDGILQPGSYDGGRKPGDVVGRLFRAVPLVATGNLVDAAIAEIDRGVDFDEQTLSGLGTLNGKRADPFAPGERVFKVGRTTGLTEGLVTAIELDRVRVDFDKGVLSFDSQIEIEGAFELPFSAGGDSGSLIVDEDGYAGGLLFAGGDTGGANGRGLTYANDIDNVAQLLDIQF